MTRARWAGLVVIAVALTGCGGIPTSGSVEAGRLIEPEALIDVGFNPGDPQIGATPSEIMQGFIAAATNPQNNYEVARKYLDESIREDWDPDYSTQIRTGIAQPRSESEGETEAAASYTFTGAAHVNADGQYVDDDPATQVLDFTFVRDENDEWRIASADDGIVLTRESFNSIFEPHPLYFFDPTTSYLVPDLRWFPTTSRLSTAIVRQLLKGQSTWLQQGVTNTYFPTGTKLDSTVTIDAGVATVALSGEALDASAAQVQLMRQQLRDTLGTVSSVVITVNGVVLEEQDGGTSPAVAGLTVENQPLVLQDSTYGFLAANGGVSALTGQSAEVADLGATDATLARSGTYSAVLTPSGVWRVFTSSTPPLQIDSRAGLLAPATDNAGFVWTMPSSDVSAITAYDSTGKAYPISAPQLAGIRGVSFTISRDGTRALILGQTDLGPRLYVAGIIRADGVPTQLGELRALPIESTSAPLDATWVDDNTVATLTVTAEDDRSTVTSYQIGGPRTAIGRIDGGVAIVGGNGLDGLRVLGSDGAVYNPRGTSWANTGYSVSFIATQQ